MVQRLAADRADRRADVRAIAGCAGAPATLVYVSLPPRASGAIDDSHAADADGVDEPRRRGPSPKAAEENRVDAHMRTVRIGSGDHDGRHVTERHVRVHVGDKVATVQIGESEVEHQDAWVDTTLHACWPQAALIT
jgi:hypothetical protein